MGTICDCGCGGPSYKGRRFAKYHNLSASGRQLRWTGRKYEYHYRLVMERLIGRPLRKGEVIHHKNGNPNDDRPENLELHSDNAEHVRSCHNNYTALFPCCVCGKMHRAEKRLRRHYCSKACSNWKNGPRPGCGRIAACETCGKPFRDKPGGQQRFCSRECASASRAGTHGSGNERDVTYAGETHSIAEWARRSGVPYKALHQRLTTYKWSPERAFTQPVRKSRARV